MARLLFVCSGNICRSPLAHALFADLLKRRGLDARYEVESAGTSAYHVGDNADARMRRTALRHGLRIDHRARQLCRRDLEYYDLILVMDRQNHASVLSLTGDEDGVRRTRMFREFDPQAGGDLEVPDPYYGGEDGFELVYAIAERTVHGLLDSLESAAAGAD